MNLLPPEITEKIIHYLPFVEIVRCERVNHLFKQTVNGYVNHYKYRKTITDALIFSAKNDDIQFIITFIEKYGSILVVLEILFKYGTLFVMQTFWNNQIIRRPMKVLDFCTKNESKYWSMLDRLGIPFLEWIEKTNNMFPKMENFESQNPDVIKWLARHNHYLDKINDVHLFRLGMIDLAKELIEKNIIKLDYPHHLLHTFNLGTINWCLKHYSGDGFFLSDSVHPKVVNYLVLEKSLCGKGFMELACKHGQEDVINKLLSQPIKHNISVDNLVKYHHFDLFIKYFEMNQIDVIHYYQHLITLNRTDLIIKKALDNPRISEHLIGYQLINNNGYDLIREMISKGCAYKYENICGSIKLIDISINHPKANPNQLLDLLIHNGISTLKKWFPRLNYNKINRKMSLYTYPTTIVTFLMEKDLIGNLRELEDYVKRKANCSKLVSTYITHTNSYSILNECPKNVLVKIMKKIPIPISCEKQWKRYDEIMANANENH